jgi:hypothetical protein
MGGAPQSSSVLAARAPLVSAAPPPQPLLPSLDPEVQCGYCGKYRHTEAVCHKKQRDKKARRGASSGSSAPRSASALEQEVLTLFHRLNVVTPFGITA